MTTEMKFKVGDRVYWTDPDEDTCSGHGRVTWIQGEGETDVMNGTDERIIELKMDSGSEVECYKHELN